MPIYLDDRKLAKRLLGGDERAFNRFFDDNFARLYRFTTTRMGDDHEAAREIVAAAARAAGVRPASASAPTAATVRPTSRHMSTARERL